ncbi:nuclear transcription factor Y subunit C-4-like [Dioscorea cayenensis subsp. rotundata]|uniref:Nuclear transcription factor Y subunit C-4-like n=1 Tax=Dioscorea cayennensis subsp. rotundata TaxID=55577 RepID=A0AB40CTD9_DIOCR|nr:nuclear transcription factor Y subunit C-4-like [Dioscorea cayenensis subsp. rotundata]
MALKTSQSRGDSAAISLDAISMDGLPSKFSVCCSCPPSASDQEASQVYNYLQVPKTPQTDHVMINDVQRELRLQTTERLNEHQRKHLQSFWQNQMREIDSLPVSKQNQLPLTKIKKVMKLDKSVKMVSASAPVVLGKACEFLIMDMTVRSWLRKESTRNVLLKADLAGAILDTDYFDFLADLVTDDNTQEESDE